jgi:hypothetical protein
VLALLVDAVYAQHAGAARAVAQAQHGAVDMQEGGIIFVQLVVVAGAEESLRSIVQGLEAEGRIYGLDAQGATGRCVRRMTSEQSSWLPLSCAGADNGCTAR